MAKVAYRHYAPTRTQTRNTFQSFGGATMGTLVVKLGSPRRLKTIFRRFFTPSMAFALRDGVRLSLFPPQGAHFSKRYTYEDLREAALNPRQKSLFDEEEPEPSCFCD